VARVLTKDRVGGGELVEDAERDVGEIPDRCRADREGHALPHSVERLERNERRTDQAGSVAELGLDDLQRLVRRLDRFGTGSHPGRLEHEVAGSGTEATTDDHDVRVEDIGERPDRSPEQPADLRQSRDCSGITLARPPHEDRGIGTGPEERGSRSIGCEPGGVGLEVPPPVTVPLARLPPGDHDHVPELGPAAIEMAVDDDAAADAGAEGEHDHVCRPLPRTEPPFGEGGGIAVVLDAGREPVALVRAIGEVHLMQREIHGAQGDAGPAVDVEGNAVSDRGRTVGEKILDDPVDRAEHVGLASVGGRDLDRAADRPVARDEAGENLRPAEVDPDNTFFTHVAATITARMPEQEKPYRVYKGGRAKGKVPLQRPGPDRRKDSSAGTTPGAPRRHHVGRWITLTLVVVLLLAVVWLVTSYLSVSSGIKDANARLPAAAASELKSQSGLLSSTPTTILVLGTDGGTGPGRSEAHRSDSVMLIRTDPGKHRLAFLSIPRDLRVEIPGHGSAKLNAASQIGGPALTLKTVKNLTGLDVNHVAVVDFDRFRELIDSVGGVDIVVPKPILSNRFDCPYATSARCRQWEGWRFAKGRQHMNGQRALVYSRIRENRLDPSETDLDRARRQQQVVQATAARVTSIGGALKMPFRGGSIVKPLATDLSAAQVLELGWAYFRADKGHALHCRLGGEPGSADGQSVIFGSEDNVATIAMFTGRSAPLPPPKGLPYAPGCAIGDRRL